MPRPAHRTPATDHPDVEAAYGAPQAGAAAAGAGAAGAGAVPAAPATASRPVRPGEAQVPGRGSPGAGAVPGGRSAGKGAGAAPGTPFESYMVAPGFRYVGRNGAAGPESDHERHLILPALGNNEPRDHAWAIGRFAAESMADHAALLASLMPPESAGAQRQSALAFHAHFVRLLQRLDGIGPPAPSDVQGFADGIVAELEPFIAAMRDAHDAQVGGTLRSNVWPSLFELARRESEYWVARLRKVASGDVVPVRSEVVAFWAPVMAEHAEILAHLVDPSETEVVEAARRRALAFQRAAAPGAGAVPTMTPSFMQAPASVERLCEDAVAAATDVARRVEANQVKGILTPALADNLRRKATWFRDELARSV